ncbi:ATP adenylyltransferase-domain-containing protein [Naematelia encephala]|uniref:ATP adenylyltransferase-domain-containing protein n=1 Tax=Naematelia encephala TaxID=71784 RepID=A0A1Y2AKG2_9TREE|nr:ATP adenylyltransferase-domain-containing protein [Naematelia encephala]
MAYPNNPSSPTELLTSLPDKFEAARHSGQLFFFESTAKDVYSSGRRFNLRCCPALLNKAKAKADALAALKKDGSPEAKRQRIANGDGEEHNKQNTAEPFKPPYVPELYVGCLEGLEDEPGMSILLNKYAVLPEHMLLCPPTYQPQNLPPTPPQLALAHQILVAASRHPTRPRRLLAFYNGGEGAGASQKWRHLQFIEVPGGRAPVEEWVQGVRFDQPNEPVVVPDLPYLHIVHPLPPIHSITYPPTSESSSELIDFLAPALMKCLDLAIDSLRFDGGKKDGGWNLLMTLEHLHLIPRSSPSFALDPPHEALELNSLGYAGMMLVRSEEEEKALLAKVEQDGGLMKVLKECGVPREWGEKAIEAAQIQHGMEQHS